MDQATAWQRRLRISRERAARGWQHKWWAPAKTDLTVKRLHLQLALLGVNQLVPNPGIAQRAILRLQHSKQPCRASVVKLILGVEAGIAICNRRGGSGGVQVVTFEKRSFGTQHPEATSATQHASSAQALQACHRVMAAVPAKAQCSSHEAMHHPVVCGGTAVGCRHYLQCTPRRTLPAEAPLLGSFKARCWKISNRSWRPMRCSGPGQCALPLLQTAVNRCVGLQDMPWQH